MIQERQTTASLTLHLDKSLPQLPQFAEAPNRHSCYGFQTFSNTVLIDRDGQTSDSTIRGPVPQFRESRRWAKAHGCAEQPNRSDRRLSKDSLLAVLPALEYLKSQKISQRDRSFDQQRALPKTISSQSPIPAIELGYSNSIALDKKASHDSRCWRLGTSAVVRLSRVKTKSWPRGPAKSKRKSAGRRDVGCYLPTFDFSLPSTLRLQNKDRIARSNSSMIRRSFHQKQASAQKNRASSPVPSLHDPLKDRKFSDECKQMLKSSDSGSKTPPYSSFSTIDGMEGASRHQVRSRSIQVEDIIWRDFSFEAKSQKSDQQGTKESEADDALGPKSTSMDSQPVHQVKPSAMATDSTTNLQLDLHTTPICAGLTVPHEQQENADHTPLPTPARSIMSIDTMAGIEAQVQKRQCLRQNSYVARLSMDDTSTSSINRNSGPPPNIPLPALPPQARDQRCETRSFSEICRSESYGSVSSATTVEFSRHVVCTTRTEKVRAQRLKDLAKLPRHSLKADVQGQTLKGTPKPPIFPSPIREIMDQLDRFPEVPISRPSSMGSMSAWSAWSRRPSPIKTTVRQLQWMSKSHVENRTTTASQQKLSQSNIFVVVDSDPVTAKFLAGVRSPTPSIGGTSPEQRSPRYAPNSSSKLREVMINPQRPPKISKSDNGPRNRRRQIDLAFGLASPYTNGNNKRPATSEIRHSNHLSVSQQSPSSTSTPLSPETPTAKSRKWRRWNSGDINVMKLLQRDLEEYYTTIKLQEEKIKWQAHEIQMMTRVFAPMNRLRDVKGAPLLQDSPDLPLMTGENPLSRSMMRNSWCGANDLRQLDLGSRSTLNIIKEQQLNMQAATKLVNEGALKRTSAPVQPSSRRTAAAMDPFKCEMAMPRDNYECQAMVKESRYYRM